MIGVLWFPGMNCEQETQRILEAVGMKAEIVRWNAAKLNNYDAFILPGGWSFEDRVRAGVIASKDHLLDGLREQAEQGKPVLGICNGCQILVESGMVPDDKKEAQFALAPNHNPFVSGYYCTWIHVKNTGKKHVFNSLLEKNEVLQMPIAHGEGRFITTQQGLVEDLKKNGQIAFTYCDKEGNTDVGFPHNPNGATANIAGITNKKGNVLAVMPHPERSSFLYQQRDKEMHNFEDAMRFTSSAKIFESLREALK